MEITYKYYSSFEMNEKEKNDFIKVFNEVFNENWTSETFNRKYIENIYGNFYIIIAYDNTLPVGIRSYSTVSIGRTRRAPVRPGDAE